MKVLEIYDGLPVYSFNVGDAVTLRPVEEQIRLGRKEEYTISKYIGKTLIVSKVNSKIEPIFGHFVNFKNDTHSSYGYPEMYSCRLVPAFKGGTREVVE